MTKEEMNALIAEKLFKLKPTIPSGKFWYPSKAVISFADVIDLPDYCGKDLELVKEKLKSEMYSFRIAYSSHKDGLDHRPYYAVIDRGERDYESGYAETEGAAICAAVIQMLENEK